MHYYQDVSNFRAPYDNFAVSGLGAHIVQGEPGYPLAHEGIEKHENGLWYFTPERAKYIIASLEHSRAVPAAADATSESVTLVPWTEAEAQAPEFDALRAQFGADAWFARQVKAERFVAAPANIATPGARDVRLGSGTLKQEEIQFLAASGVTKELPMLHDPAEAKAGAGIGLGMGLLIVGAAVGGIYGISRLVKRYR